MSLLSSALGVSTHLVSQLIAMRLATHTMRTLARSEIDGSGERRRRGRPEQGEHSRSRADTRARKQCPPAHSSCAHPIVSRT